MGCEARAVPGEMVNRESHQCDADPSDNAANDLGIGGTEEPTQILAREITEDAHHLQTEDPAGVQADGEVQVAGAHERVTQYHANQKETENAGQNRHRIEERLEGGGQMAKPGERIDAVEEIAFTRFYEVQYGIKKIGQDVGAERMSLLAQAEKENAAKKNFFEKGSEYSRQQGARATRQRLFQGQTKKRREDITRGH